MSLEHPRRETTLVDYRNRLLRAQQLLQARLDEPVDPAALARAAHFSLHHFHRIFRAQMGESVMQHVRRLRLERAARKLRAGDARLLDLAIEAGYESHEAFTRAFAAHFDVAPSLYREQSSARVKAHVEHGPERAPVAVRIEHYPALRVAFMRHRGSYAKVGTTWDTLVAWAAARGLLREHEAPLYGLCPDDPDVTAEHLLRFDACVVAGDDMTGDEAATITQIEAGTYAVGVHRGSYQRLAETYLDIIGYWFPNSGYEPAPDPVVEHYLNDPTRTKESELLTEVRVRIA